MGSLLLKSRILRTLAVFLLALSARAAAPLEEMEREMFRLLNKARAEENLPPLEYDDKLADIARRHSADMRDNTFFQHKSKKTGTLEDRMAAAPYNALTMRENLADARDARRGHDGLMESPGHYANIMAKDVTHVGVGIVQKPRKPYNFLFTQVFARPFVPESGAEARQRILDAVQAARKGKRLKPLEPATKLDVVAVQGVNSVPSKPTKADMKKASQAVTARLKKKPVQRLRSVAVSVQYLAQSGDYTVPPELVDPTTTVYGLAVRRVAEKKGRPMLIVLTLVGL